MPNYVSVETTKPNIWPPESIDWIGSDRMTAWQGRTEKPSAMVRTWLASPPPKVQAPVRVRRMCGKCPTWLFGATSNEAEERLATHRRTRHAARPCPVERVQS